MVGGFYVCLFGLIYYGVFSIVFFSAYFGPFLAVYEFIKLCLWKLTGFVI